MDCGRMILRLQQSARPDALEDMARYGISTTRALVSRYRSDGSWQGNRALREIGIRDTRLNALARESARSLTQSGSASARRFGRDAMRELERKIASGRLRSIC